MFRLAARAIFIVWVDIMFDEKYVENTTGSDVLQRKQLISGYARLDEASKIEVHRRQRELFRDWVAEGRIPPNRGGESNYSALIVAIRDFISFGPLSSDLMAQTAAPQRKQRKQRLRSSLEKRFMGELIRLREEQNMSWRQLSDYFRKEFRKTVSHTYLKRIYDEHIAG